MRRVAAEVSAPRDTRTWNVFLRQSGAELTGTILRVDGDTGTLVGHWQNDKLVLSHFAGERPNLFEATLNQDGTLAVTLNGTAHYLVVRKGEARAKGIPEPPDPSRYTSVKDPTAPFQFAFPDLAGQIVSDTDARFRGKVVILSIGGSWCPNCHDEAPFLSEVYRDYRARGLEIVGLMFENDPDPNVSRSSRPVVHQAVRRRIPDAARRNDAAVAHDEDHQRSAAATGQLRRVPDDDLSWSRWPRAERARRLRQSGNRRRAHAAEAGSSGARRASPGRASSGHARQTGDKDRVQGAGFQLDSRASLLLAILAAAYQRVARGATASLRRSPRPWTMAGPSRRQRQRASTADALRRSRAPFAHIPTTTFTPSSSNATAVSSTKNTSAARTRSGACRFATSPTAVTSGTTCAPSRKASSRRSSALPPLQARYRHSTRRCWIISPSIRTCRSPRAARSRSDMRWR